MIRRPDLHWPAAAGHCWSVLAVAACVPANADPADHGSSEPRPRHDGRRRRGGHPALDDRRTTATPARRARRRDVHRARPARRGRPTATPKPTRTIRPGTAVTTLATLTIKGRAPRTGYDRDLFGQAWADVDRNGCDTRNDILRRDLTRYTLKAGTHGCLVLKGTLNDPYTGTTISFVRGQGTSNAVQIDHVVALSDAWQKGAQQWSQTRRTAFANDPLNLLAVDGPTNLRKGDGDAATWLPPAQGGPLRLRRPPDRGQAPLRAVGDRRRAGRDGAGAHGLPGSAPAHGRAPSRSAGAASKAARRHRQPPSTTPKPSTSVAPTPGSAPAGRPTRPATAPTAAAPTPSTTGTRTGTTTGSPANGRHQRRRSRRGDSGRLGP